MGSQRALTVHRRRHRVARPGKGNKERIPLSADLMPTMVGECGPQHPSVLSQDAPVAVTQIL
jgi:hypothetical protein